VGGLTYTETIACCDPSCACEEDEGTGSETQTECCENPIPDTLLVTITDKTGDCADVLPDTIEAVRTPELDWTFYVGGHRFSMGCSLDPPVLNMIPEADLREQNFLPEGNASCDPLYLEFRNVTVQFACEGTATFIYTEAP